MSYLDKQEYLCGDEQEFKSKESEDDPYNNIKGQKFDFSNPEQVITVQGAIAATFENPDRKKFPSVTVKKNDPPATLVQNPLSAAEYISQVSGKRPTLKFNRKEIWVCDDSRLIVQDLEKWLDEAKNLKWYGPFSHPQGNYLVFSARPSNGQHNSMNLRITKNCESVFLTYRDFDDGDESAYFGFW